MNTRSVTALALALTAAPTLANSDWLTDFDAARKVAVEEKKDLLLGFTGLDWNSWCQKLKQEVFDHEAFEREAKKKFVLVSIDFPRSPENKAKMPAAIRKQNASLKKEFGVPGYPRIVLCDEKGRPYAESDYQKGGPAEFLAHLEELRKNRTVRDEAFAKAAQAEGAARALFLEEALRVVPHATLQTVYKRDFDELVALAPKCALVTTVTGTEAAEEQRGQFRSLFVSKDYQGVIVHADALLTGTGLQGEARQEVMLYKLNAYLAMGKQDEALKMANEITSTGAESPFGKRAEQFRQYLEKRKKEEKESGVEDKANPAPADEEPAKKKSASHLLEGREMWLIAQEQPAGEEAPEKESKAKVPSEEVLKIRIAETRKEIEEVRHKIAADHELWESSETAMRVAKARIAELVAALENEKVRFKKLEDTVVRIEKEHNGDHDAEETLRSQLAEREKDLKEYQRKQEEITKLEREAEELRRAAEKLRVRSEELKKK